MKEHSVGYQNLKGGESLLTSPLTRLATMDRSGGYHELGPVNRVTSVTSVIRAIAS